QVEQRELPWGHVVELEARRWPGDERVTHPRERPRRHVDVDVSLLERFALLRDEIAEHAVPGELPVGRGRNGQEVEERRHEIDVAALRWHVVGAGTREVDDEGHMD